MGALRSAGTRSRYANPVTSATIRLASLVAVLYQNETTTMSQAPSVCTSALLPVLFRGAALSLIDHQGEPFVAMRPLVEAMGMDWPTQQIKIKQRYSSTVGETPTVGSTVKEILTVAEDGKRRAMTCLPLRKLAGWLMTISVNKVRPELRDTIRAYQAQCDDVLWDFWSRRPKPEPAWPVLLPEAPPPDPLADPRVRAAISKKAHDLSLAAFEHNREILERYLRRDWNLTDPESAIERIHALDLDHGKHMLVDTQQLFHLTSTVAATERCLTVALAAIRTLEDSTGRQLYGRAE